MSVAAGKDWLLKIGDGAGPEVFTTLGGLRTASLSISAEEIDVTDIGSGQNKTLLDGAGILSMAISGSGLFDDTTSLTRLRTVMMDQSLCNFEIIDAPGNSFKGAFKVKSLEYQGEYKGATEWKISLQSSGAIVFTAHS